MYASEYLLISIGIIVNDMWFNAHFLNCQMCQLEVSVKATIPWNTGKYDAFVVGIPKCFNSNGINSLVQSYTYVYITM